MVEYETFILRVLGLSPMLVDMFSERESTTGVPSYFIVPSTINSFQPFVVDKAVS